MDQKEYKELIASFEESAQEGSIVAMKYLGDLYYAGQSGKEKNTAAALPYWKRVADSVGLLSKSSTSSSDESDPLAQLAAGGESVALSNAAFLVGDAYLKGKGCAEDKATALHYYTIAADYGDVDGQYATGLCYETGIGCPIDETIAMRYYKKAALEGHGQAQFRLGYLQLINKDREAFHWFCCAHISGVEEATEVLNDMVNDGYNLESLQYQIEKIKENGIDPQNDPTLASKYSSNSGGCYIATCVYGSYDCPQVWTLRRFRDNTLAAKWYGRAFIHIYYAISPLVVKMFGNTKWFKSMWRRKLDRLVDGLGAQGVESTPYEDKRW